MQTEFVKYELAVELVKLGFNDTCFGGYTKKEKDLWVGYVGSQGGEQFNREYHILAPLYQQAFKFVRQKYDLCYSIDPFDDNTYDYTVFNPNITEMEEFDEGPYDTYEEAELACLTRLIIIVKGLGK